MKRMAERVLGGEDGEDEEDEEDVEDVEEEGSNRFNNFGNNICVIRVCTIVPHAIVSSNDRSGDS